MKAIIGFICTLTMILLISAKSDKIPVFTLNKFEETFSKINDKFYMSKYEVTNLQYLTFIEELKKNNEIEKYNIAQIDTSQWNTVQYEPYASLYHRHPAYSNYPVVNISYEGALLFCEWLTNKYNTYSKKKFKKVLFRLPTKEEWENAAHGGLKQNDYPWGGYLLNDWKGQDLCSYMKIRESAISYNREKDDFEIINMGQASISFLCEVDYYKENGYGIFNISGNAAEMTQEKGIARGGSYLCPGYDVRIESTLKYDKPSTEIGFRICMDIIEI